MAIQSLTPPQDITWTRLAFSRDMIDTHFGDMVFPPKWRSSLAVYFYVVPDEETADAYPNSRIVYLKLTCSITGWNPSENLINARKAAEEVGSLDDFQRTLWTTIVASGWASKYWPCLGAIMQIGVYPNAPGGVATDDYPYIMDFEPKKREIFEGVTEGSERLSGSADKATINKGSTSVTGTEFGGSAGFSVGGIGASASASRTKTDTTVHQNTTDTSREARETVSHTTSSSQMYQLFNGYHLGTNRALFVVAPRPHIVSNASQTEFNLIDGERKLEGVQDVFIVVHMPRSLDGFCVQASLDTGHQATSTIPHSTMMRPKDGTGPTGDVPPADPDPDPLPPATPVKQLIVTRRVVQSCGTFDDNGNFHIRQLREPIRDIVVGEFVVADTPERVMRRANEGADGRAARASAADQRNSMQSRINRLMLDNASSVMYSPKPFTQTDVFRSLAAHSMRASGITISELADKGYVTAETVRGLAKMKIITLAHLFGAAPSGADNEDARDARRKIIEKLLSASRP